MGACTRKAVLAFEKEAGENMLRHEENHIGDSWYFVKNDICHCFYLTCPMSEERHTAWDIAHATSKDLVHWERHGIVLSKGRAGEWDEKCLSTGSVIEWKGRFWMSYTGRWDSYDGKIGIAVSDDLYHWEKLPQNPVILPDTQVVAPLGRGLRKFCHWRDAKLIRHDGNIYALVCATSKTALADACGTVAICRSVNMKAWRVIGEVQVEPICQELECPQIYNIGGKYVLLFSCFHDLFADWMIEKYGEKLRQTSYYMVSDSIWGPYHFVPDFNLLPNDCPDLCQNVQYANQFVKMNGAWYIMGTVWSEEGDYLADGRKLSFENF